MFEAQSFFRQSTDKVGALMKRKSSFIMTVATSFVLAMGLILITNVPSVALADEVSCQCLEPKCGPCEEELGVDFYTEKCGPGLSKLKSCKRPQCRPVHDQEICLAKLKGEAAPQRSIAGTPSPEPRSADVTLAAGHAQVERIGAQHQKLREEVVKDMKVYAGDRIITKEDGRVRIRFPELSEIFISPGSDIIITEALIEKRQGPAKRTIMLDLMKGRVRSRVQGRYNDGESKFEVKTPAAVAGVRGTDFTVSFEEGAQWKTEVRTMTGEVSLDGFANSAGAAQGDRHAAVAAGTYAAYVVPAPPPNATQFEIDAVLSRGFMSPVFKMSTDDMNTLDREMSEASMLESTGFVKNKDLAKNGRMPAGDADLCQAPSAAYNKCSWTCEGNPKGSKTCRTDLANVRCVRRLCRANGVWAEPTVLPTKQGANCEASKSVVGDCGGYW